MSGPQGSSGVSSPCGSGLMRVRAMRASMCCSISELTAKAAPARSQMPSVAIATIRADGIPGVARNMPMTAQKIASCVTRGLVSAQYCDASWLSERWVEMIWPRIESVGSLADFGLADSLILTPGESLAGRSHADSTPTAGPPARRHRRYA